MSGSAFTGFGSAGSWVVLRSGSAARTLRELTAETRTL